MKVADLVDGRGKSSVEYSKVSDTIKRNAVQAPRALDGVDSADVGLYFVSFKR